jgi:hypothetical protein
VHDLAAEGQAAVVIQDIGNCGPAGLVAAKMTALQPRPALDVAGSFPAGSPALTAP